MTRFDINTVGSHAGPPIDTEVAVGTYSQRQSGRTAAVRFGEYIRTFQPSVAFSPGSAYDVYGILSVLDYLKIPVKTRIGCRDRGQVKVVIIGGIRRTTARVCGGCACG